MSTGLQLPTPPAKSTRCQLLASAAGEEGRTRLTGGPAVTGRPVVTGNGPWLMLLERVHLTHTWFWLVAKKMILQVAQPKNSSNFAPLVVLI